jgi:putative ABC transport system permease protein
MRFLLSLAWRDLRSGGRRLWIFCACLVLGVTLVAAAGSLHAQLAQALRGEARMLLGGDLEVETRDPLPAEALAWLRARGDVSAGVELRTMLRLADGQAQLVELYSADDRYPLYGEVLLAPRQPFAQALQGRGVAIDGALAQRMGVRPGDEVRLGDLALRVAALIERQPDRSLRADWNGAPVLVSAETLAATGLVQPLSRVEYVYRLRTAEPGTRLRDGFRAAFPALAAQVRTFEQRSERMAQVLAQIGSGLMIIGFSALFIGGLGVFNSVQAYLQGKLATLATLRSLGLRDARLAALVLLQILLLALLASAAGVALGNLLAWAAVGAAQERLPVRADLAAAVVPSLLALAFGVLTALTFALPALGRALSVPPAVLFRGAGAVQLALPPRVRLLTAGVGAATALLVVAALPDPRFGLAFLAAAAALLVLLEGIRLALRRMARAVLARARLSFELRVALAGLARPDSPLRPALLSLGTAVTLLVACTLAVAGLLRLVNETMPRDAPALVFYDVQADQRALLRETLAAAGGLERLQTAPLVLGRLVAVNGRPVAAGPEADRGERARRDHKLSTRGGNVDDVIVERGAWWDPAHRGEPLVAMENREADPLGLVPGDRLTYEILGQPVEARLAAIYAQRGMQSRLWLEGIFSDGVLDPFITRYVGAAWLAPGADLAAQRGLAAVAPSIASLRTEALLRESRALLARAGGGLVVVALVCLAASLLVLASVVAASRSRQVYEATVMHAIGARHASLRRVLLWEYALLALVTCAFAALAGSLLATLLLQWRLRLDPGGLYWTGFVTAVLVSVLSLGLGARYLLGQMRLAPALLLRSGG